MFFFSRVYWKFQKFPIVISKYSSLQLKKCLMNETNFKLHFFFKIHITFLHFLIGLFFSFFFFSKIDFSLRTWFTATPNITDISMRLFSRAVTEYYIIITYCTSWISTSQFNSLNTTMRIKLQPQKQNAPNNGIFSQLNHKNVRDPFKMKFMSNIYHWICLPRSRPRNIS